MVNALHDGVAHAVDDTLHVCTRPEVRYGTKELWGIKLGVNRENSIHLLLEWIAREIAVAENTVG